MDGSNIFRMNLISNVSEIVIGANCTFKTSGFFLSIKYTNIIRQWRNVEFGMEVRYVKDRHPGQIPVSELTQI